MTGGEEDRKWVCSIMYDVTVPAREDVSHDTFQFYINSYILFEPENATLIPNFIRIAFKPDSFYDTI